MTERVRNRVVGMRFRKSRIPFCKKQVLQVRWEVRVSTTTYDLGGANGYDGIEYEWADARPADAVVVTDMINSYNADILRINEVRDLLQCAISNVSEAVGIIEENPELRGDTEDYDD